jgi:hypothetical protein
MGTASPASKRKSAVGNDDARSADEEGTATATAASQERDGMHGRLNDYCSSLIFG